MARLKTCNNAALRAIDCKAVSGAGRRTGGCSLLLGIEEAGWLNIAHVAPGQSVCVERSRR